MRTPEEILKDIVKDVSEMRLSKVTRLNNGIYGPFVGEQSHKDYSVEIEWPNLELLVREAAMLWRKKK